MKHINHPRKILTYLLTLLILISLLPISALAEEEIDKAAAINMKLRKVEGTVKASDKNGKSISVFQEMRLYDGYNVETLRNGYAWIDLDSNKLIKLDSESRTVVQKSGKQLDIILKKGKLFFDVAKPLEEDESFSIRTSNISVGIRGTCGWVEAVGKNETRVSVLEGTVTVAVIDPVTREVKVDAISGGDNAICVAYSPAKQGDKCDIIRNRFTEKDVPGFVLVELVNDMKHVDEIFNKSKTDVDLRRLTQASAKKQLRAEQLAIQRAEEAAEKKRQENIAQRDAESSGTPETPERPETSTTPPATEPTTPPATESTTPESGDGLKYAYNSAKKTLTISADTSNVITDYEAGAQPWAAYLYDMERVVIKDGVTSIGENAFLPAAAARAKAVGGEADKLKNVTLPDSVMSIHTDAFNGCPKIETVYFGGSESQWKGKIYSFPGMLTNKKIYYATGEAYYYYDSALKTLTIAGDGKMGDYGGAFDYITYAPWGSYYSYMNNLVVEDGVTSIGNSAFKGCSGLTGELKIPGSVTTISDYAFFRCSGLTGELKIPGSVTTIGDSAFEECSGLTGELKIPDKVTTIGKLAFYKCSGLTGNLKIPGSGTTIGGGAFAGCSKLTSITIPNSVTTIGNSMFAECSGLTGELKIPDNVTTIGQDAFSGCSGLTGKLKIPDSVTTIGAFAFAGCSGLTGELKIPNSVTTIGNAAFSLCDDLTGNLTIGNSVTTIGERAFYWCRFLTSITIPNSVTTIGDAAFGNCYALKDVYFIGTSAELSAKSWRSKFSDKTTIHCTLDPAPAMLLLEDEEASAIEETSMEETSEEMSAEAGAEETSEETGTEKESTETSATTATEKESAETSEATATEKESAETSEATATEKESAKPNENASSEESGESQEAAEDDRAMMSNDETASE